MSDQDYTSAESGKKIPSSYLPMDYPFHKEMERLHSDYRNAVTSDKKLYSNASLEGKQFQTVERFAVQRQHGDELLKGSVNHREHFDGTPIKVFTFGLWVVITADDNPRNASVIRSSLSHDFFCFNGHTANEGTVTFERSGEIGWSHDEAVHKAKAWVVTGEPQV